MLRIRPAKAFLRGEGAYPAETQQKSKDNRKKRLNMLVHACNPSPRKIRSLRIALATR